VGSKLEHVSSYLTNYTTNGMKWKVRAVQQHLLTADQCRLVVVVEVVVVVVMTSYNYAHSLL
jgi:uncharacterized protein YpmS